MSLCFRTHADPSAPRAPVLPPNFRFNRRTYQPSSALAPFVDHYWATRWDRRGLPARAAAMLLDPCVHLQIRDGRAQLLGVVRGAYRMTMEGAGCVVGVKFRPGGFHPFVRQPVSRWTDRVASAHEVFGTCALTQIERPSEAWDAVAALGGDAERASIVAALEALLGACQPERDAVAEEVSALVMRIATDAGMRRVRDLVRVSGRSERTLLRLFTRYVGASPAWVIRRYRLHAAVARLATISPADAGAIAAVAWELGYADQAHLIRDFHSIVGTTPGVYVGARPRERQATHARSD